MVYGTDGEMAIENGFETHFPIDGPIFSQRNIHLRCKSHLSNDMEIFCKDNGINEETGGELSAQILGYKSNGMRALGIIDALNLELLNNV